MDVLAKLGKPVALDAHVDVWAVEQKSPQLPKMEYYPSGDTMIKQQDVKSNDLLKWLHG